MGLHNNDGKGYRTISDLIAAILEVTDLFSAKEIRSAVTEMHKRRKNFNDQQNGDDTHTVWDKY